MMKLRIICMVLAMVMSIHVTMAQRKATLVKMSFQHFLAATVKLNIEREISPLLSVYVNPAYTMIDRKYKRAFGPGVEVGAKKYFRNTSGKQLSGFYVSGDVTYHYFDAEYKSHSTYTSYGIPYTVADSVFVPETIHKWGGDIMLGYQASSRKFYIDFYLGIGCRFGSSSRGGKSGFRENALAYVYSDSAIIPKAGFTLGVRIN